MASINVVRHNHRDCLPAAQARLLKQINKGFPDPWWERYHELIEKRQDGILSAAALRQLIRLTDQLEKREAKRLQYLVRLAKLRKQSLTDLMADLGLPGKTDG